MIILADLIEGISSLVTSVMGKIGDIFLKYFFGIFVRPLFKLMDTFIEAMLMLAGINPIGTGDSDNLITTFLQKDGISDLYMYIAIFSAVLLIVLAIVEVIKKDFFTEEVIRVASSRDYVLVEGEFGTIVKGGMLVIATGGSPIRLGVPGENLPHVHYCATCDGALYQDKEVAVIGDANTALQYAVELSNICEKVHVCAIGRRLHGEQVWIDRVKNTPNIEVHYDFDTIEITENQVCSEDGRNIHTDGVFVAIGYKPTMPDTGKICCPVNISGYVRTFENMHTEQRVLFIGDVREKPYRQIASAVNDGMIAALTIIKN